ncbi:MAG: tRNA (adenosine(37)-N6)-threonylcarbamoyltransferase complex dimerization subunit type 1 TsaB [Spiroplasma sp.]|nr:tRNA (adenosine(37)-N6)-threonylcarbamoyltransferase complex dimerization subunit type 1 TsaB [Spiroplasma sp.]
MYKLYLDCSGAILTIIVTKSNQVLASFSNSAAQKQTELAVETINNLLTKTKLSLKDINEVIITTGPGSYTGVRVGISFVKTLAVLNPKLKVFTVNTLLLQAGLKKAISIIAGYNQKSYLAVYNQGKEVIAPQLVTETAKQGIINDLKDFEVLIDYKTSNIIDNFLILNSKSDQIKVEDLKPLYLGDNFH